MDLRLVLRGNAAFSLLSGGAFALFGPTIAPAIGLDGAPIFGLIEGGAFLRLLGIGVFIFGAGVAYTSNQPPAALRIGAAIILALDVAWIVLSALLLLSNALPLTSGGVVGVIAIADIVALFAVGEFMGLRGLARQSGGAHSA